MKPLNSLQIHLSRRALPEIYPLQKEFLSATRDDVLLTLRR